MKVTTTPTGQKEPEQQFYKFYSEQELLNCLKTECITVNAVLSLIESNFAKDKTISELTRNIAELTKRITFLEKKALQKSGRPRQTYWVNGQELTDEFLVELIDYGYYDSIGKLEKDVGASKNQLRNRYKKAKEKIKLKKAVKEHEHS